MNDSLKTVGSSTGTLLLSIWEIVPEMLGVVLIIINIVYLLLKIKAITK